MSRPKLPGEPPPPELTRLSDRPTAPAPASYPLPEPEELPTRKMAVLPSLESSLPEAPKLCPQCHGGQTLRETPYTITVCMTCDGSGRVPADVYHAYLAANPNCLVARSRKRREKT